MAMRAGLRWWRLVVLMAALAGLAALAPAVGARLSASTRAKTNSAKATPAKTKPLPVPAGFVGVDGDGALFSGESGIDVDAQLKTMVASGVQSLRVAFSWAGAQPYARAADVPAADLSQYTEVGGVPTDFSKTDAIVGAAARRRLSVLPTVLYAPGWDAKPGTIHPAGFDQPRSDGPYAAYLTALIHRYGPHGSFWSQNPSIPRMPIREWQIWNEPNLGTYWKAPFASSYVALLRAAHTAIKRADPRAKVVLGALTGYAWSGLRAIYRVRGAERLFDVVSVNAFTKLPANVIKYLQFVRGVMKQHGDGSKPLLATELSWPSAVGQTKVDYDFDTTPAGQARNLARLLPLLGKDRIALGLAGFDWYTWIGDEWRGAGDFHFSGLEKVTNGVTRAKPALAAFRRAALALERCRAKGAVATRCIK